MEKHMPLVFMVAGVAAVALAAFAWYRWRQRQRVRGVEAGVRDYLTGRFGRSLERVSINCSDDLLWPVLVGFDDVQTGLRHRLQFSCQGPPSALRLVSEESGKH